MAEDKKKTVKVVVKIKEIKLLGFQVTEYGNALEHSIPDDKYQATFELGSNLNLEIKAIETMLTVKLFDNSVEDNPLPLLATLRMKFDLLIRNFDELAINDNGTMKVPNDVIKIAFSSAIGAARGMFVLCSGIYKFSNAIIPLINIDSLMERAKGGLTNPNLQH